MELWEFAAQYIGYSAGELPGFSSHWNGGDWCALFVWYCLANTGINTTYGAGLWYPGAAPTFKYNVHVGNLEGENSLSSLGANSIVCWNSATNPGGSGWGHGSHVGILCPDGTAISGNWKNQVARHANSGPGALGGPVSDEQGIVYTYLGAGAAPEIPDKPPEGEDPSSGHYEMKPIYSTVRTYHEFDYGDYLAHVLGLSDPVSENGVGPIFKNDSGSQDTPLAPTEISSSTDRQNQQWAPINMYTYERTLTYDQNNNPIWSSWEQKYSGSKNIKLGEQPSYGNGWEMDWGDE